MTTLYGKQELTFIVSDLLKLSHDLNQWEREFVASIDRQLKAGSTLSSKQNETLSRIWDSI